MAQVAPGLGPDHNERPCYNCGVRGHMFTACPEEPRKVPAGLEASWARQQSSNSPHNDSLVPNKRNKGPVITRYPPPPPLASSHHVAPLPRFENSLPQPYHSGPISSYRPPPPPPPSYGPGFGQGFGSRPPPNPPYDRYGPPGPPPPGPHQPLNPPPAYQGAYNAPYGPPGHVPGPYDHHHVHPPGRPNQYFSNDYPPGPPGRLEPYPETQPAVGPPDAPYGAHQQYPPGPPPPPYAPPPSFVAPPASYGFQGPPPRYHQSPPQREPPAIFEPYPQTNPYVPPYGDDRDRYERGRDHQRRYDDRRPSEPWHPQEAWHGSPPPNGQSYRDEYRDGWHGKSSYRDDRHSRRRGHNRSQDERRRDRQDRQDRFQPYNKHSDKWDRHHRRKHPPATTSNETARRDKSPPGRETPVATKTDQEREPGEIVSEPTSASDHVHPDSAFDTTKDESNEDLSWDERTIFLELPPSSKVDPIAAPLPTQYFEDIMIPPAFDAKALKSRYITPRNIDDFAQSIRETRDWQIMKHHPLFLDPTEIHLEKLDDYNKAVDKDIHSRVNRRDHARNTHDMAKHRLGNSKGSSRHQGKNQDSRYKVDTKKRRWDNFHDTDDFRWKRRSRDSPYDDPLNKRLKPASPPEPGEVVEADSAQSLYALTRAPIIDTNAANWAPGPREALDSKSQPDTVDNKSNGPSQERTADRIDLSLPDGQDNANTRPSTPSGQPADTPQEHSRPSSRQSFKGVNRSRAGSRRSSFGSDMSGSQGSSLDPIERELLGMGRPSTSGTDSGEESTKRQLSGAIPRFKRRQPMVEAYSRRW
ncbi:hypothetical protein K445DRAFT_13301 [Daldinia sp. EC12]|nr:hypothetical protein K445DRAFT_13301 [Daldinia sp. EC12]